MKAMLLQRPGPVEEMPLEPTELAEPIARRGEVVLRVRACGVCHTDLHIAEGELAPHKTPVVPGHQVVGEVVELGPAVGEFELGTRVGVPWLHQACGHCRYCLRGDENLCENAIFTGYDVDGGFAEYMTAPAAFAYALPEMTSDLEAAPLLCAGIIGYRSLRLSGVGPGGGAEAVPMRSGSRLGLFGFGAAAHICIQIAAHWGVETFVFTRSPEHRELARELGAVWAGEAGEQPGGEAGLLLDAAIVFAPAGELALEALKVVDKGATVALGGIHSSPIPLIDYDVIYGERVLRSVANSTRQDARELLELAAEIPIRTEVEPFELEDVNEALVALKHSRINGAAVLRV